MDLRKDQFIVSKDKTVVFAKMNLDFPNHQGDRFEWVTPVYLTGTRIGAKDTEVSTVNHEIVIDYLAGDICVWRYVGDHPHLAFDDTDMFTKV